MTVSLRKLQVAIKNIISYTFLRKERSCRQIKKQSAKKKQAGHHREPAAKKIYVQ